MNTYAPSLEEIDTGHGGPKWFPWVCSCGRCWWHMPDQIWLGPPDPHCYEEWKKDLSLGKERNPGAAFARALSRSAFERGRALGREEAKSQGDKK